MIYGVTDKPRFFPRVGKIRLGVRDSTKGYPKDTDHFVVTELPEVVAVYGKAPKKLIIAFPSNDIEQVFPTRLEHWKARKSREGDATARSVLFCSSDGRTATRLYIGAERDAQGHAAVMQMPAEERPDPMEMFQMACPHEDCPYFEERQCKRVGRLTFVLPEVGFAGVYQVETSSMYGFGNILDTLAWVRALTEPHVPGGRLMGAFFELTREPQSMTIPDSGGKVTIKHVLNLRVIDDKDRVLALAGRVPQWLLDGPGVKQLGPANPDRPEDLFPVDGPAALLPAAPVVEEDDLKVLRELSGLGKAQFDMLCAKAGGDLEKIRESVKELVNKAAMEEALPSTTPDPPKKQAPAPKSEAVTPKKGLLEDW